MPEKKLFVRTVCVCLVLDAATAAVLWSMGRGSARLAAGLVLGVLCSLLALWLFFRAWGAAPDKSRVFILYAARLAVEFGGIGLAVLLPVTDALGTALPQLFPIPVLAVFFALQKGD